MTSRNTQSKRRVAVVFGGRSAEHDVSLRSAETIMDALERSGHEVVPIGVTRDGRWLTAGDPMAELQAASPLFQLGERVRGRSGEVEEAVEQLAIQASRQRGGLIPSNGWQGGIDVIFPALHGPMGEDGTVQGLFELAGVPYVGSGVMASALAMDKAVCKEILARAGIPQVRWISVRMREWQRDGDRVRRAVADEIGYPCFVKPANLGSSVGVSKVHEAAELDDAITEALQHDRKIVIEQGLDAREFEVSVLGNDDPIASIVGEVVPGGEHEFYDFEAKYVDDDAELLIPADISDEAVREIQDLALRSFRVLDCAGIARVDFFQERDSGRIFLNELNTMPGFTSISMYPKLWEASGIPLPDLVARLVDLALERFDDRWGG